MIQVLYDIEVERARQDAKFGADRDFPDGVDHIYKYAESDAKAACDLAAREGRVTWRHIFLEEAFETVAETDKVLLRKELIQVAAVAVAWVEALDRRAP